jgi:signal transduction histidine kinase
MVRKPTYEELQQRIKELEQESAKSKLAEQALRGSELRHRSLIEALSQSDIGLFVVDGNYKVRFMNRALTERFGDQTGGICYTDVGKADSPCSYCKLSEVINERKTLSYQPTVVDGKTYYIVALPYTDADGALCKLEVIQDITERKRAEDALRKISERTKLFAYSVSHDLKSPVIGIYGLVKRLHQVYADVLGEKGKTYCDQILKAAEHLSALVAQINVYISTSTATLVIETVKLKDIMHMVREEFSAQLGIRQIKWSEPEHLPDLNADRIAILRVLRNLIDNALKYGGDHLTELRFDYREGGGLHILSVSNDGTKIKKEHFENLFGPFQRYESARGVEGAGLGLAIVKELVEQHGGEVWAESTQEKWTTFHVSISKNL